jgi:hypothetical protein
MKRRLMMAVAAGALVVAMVPGGAAAAQKTGCPAGDWSLGLIDVVAADFFDYLLLDYGFANETEFADAIDALYNKNGDAYICAKYQWGEDLNPKSHWYDLGPRGEPLRVLMTRDNNANGS